MDSIAERLFVDDLGNVEDEVEMETDANNRKERMMRYALRDKSLDKVLADYLEAQLIASPAFLRDFERALTETDGNVLRRLLFVDGYEWRTQRVLKDRQSMLPKVEILGLEEALAQLFPKLRRAKVPAVARAHALAVERATTGRLRSKPAPPDTGT